MSYPAPVPSAQPVRSTTRVSAVPVVASAIGAQLLDDLLYLVVPGSPVLVAPFAGLIAILLTAGAARAVTLRLTGPAVARTGLAIGVVSAGLGLLIGGLGLVALLLAGITVVAGVAGAVAFRGLAEQV